MMALTKSVPDLIKNGAELSFIVVAKKDRQWVEGVTQKSWKGEKADVAWQSFPCLKGAGLLELILNKACQIPIAFIHVVFFMKAHDVEVVD